MKRHPVDQAIAALELAAFTLAKMDCDRVFDVHVVRIQAAIDALFTERQDLEPQITRWYRATQKADRQKAQKELDSLSNYSQIAATSTRKPTP